MARLIVVLIAVFKVGFSLECKVDLKNYQAKNNEIEKLVFENSAVCPKKETSRMKNFDKNCSSTDGSRTSRVSLSCVQKEGMKFDLERTVGKSNKSLENKWMAIVEACSKKLDYCDLGQFKKAQACWNHLARSSLLNYSRWMKTNCVAINKLLIDMSPKNLQKLVTQYVKNCGQGDDGYNQGYMPFKRDD